MNNFFYYIYKYINNNILFTLDIIINIWNFFVEIKIWFFVVNDYDIINQIYIKYEQHYV